MKPREGTIDTDGREYCGGRWRTQKSAAAYYYAIMSRDARRRGSPTEGHIYMLCPLGEMTVKVGFSTPLASRRRRLQTGNARWLHTVGKWRGSYGDEQALLAELGELPGARVGVTGGTEWFNLTQPVVDHLLAWTKSREELHDVKKNKKPTQNQILIQHFKTVGHISPLEAYFLYGIQHVASRIDELRKVGFNISTMTSKDVLGRAYTRYKFSGLGLKGDVVFVAGEPRAIPNLHLP